MTEISVEGIGGVHRILYNVVCSVWCAACSVQCGGVECDKVSVEW